MPVSERDRSRLSALLATLRPAHSLAARVERLSADHREIYDQYVQRMREWIDRNDIDSDGNRGNAWAMVIRGYGPQLSDDIATKLIGPTPRILASADDNSAQQTYQRYCHG